MTIYERIFQKYKNLIETYEGDYDGLAEKAASLLIRIENPEKSRPKAIIMLGYSGNGKSTWLRNWIRNHPEYGIISMDQIETGLYYSKKRKPTDEEILQEVGEQIHEYGLEEKPMIFDGLFLNLLTRYIIIDTLRVYGYEISIVDLTPIIERTLPNRILDVAEKKLRIKITKENIDEVQRNPYFQRIAKTIMDYYKQEQVSTCFKDQVTRNLVQSGIDNIIPINQDDVKKEAEKKKTQKG